MNLPVNSSNSIEETKDNEHIKVDVGSKPKSVVNHSGRVTKHNHSVIAQSLDFEHIRPVPERGVLFEHGRKSIFSQK